MASEISASSSPLVQTSGNGVSPAAKEVVVGAAGGVTQVLIGQPFDIVKVRMQNRVDGGALHIARSLWKQEGPRGFYKGSLAPFIGVGACISIVYGSFHLVSQSLQAWQPSSPGGLGLSSSQTYLAGGLAGLANSLVSGPMEHIRIRLQMQSARPEERVYTGTADCVRRILRRGGLRALYRGQTATMLREFHSYGIWFSVYGALTARVLEADAENRAAEDQDQQAGMPGWKVAACGAVTGEILWAVNYPFDVVKSTMQADGFGADRRYRTMGDAVRSIWRVDGWRGFFRGLGPTLGRAMPVSAGTFLVVEAVRKAM